MTLFSANQDVLRRPACHFATHPFAIMARPTADDAPPAEAIWYMAPVSHGDTGSVLPRTVAPTCPIASSTSCVRATTSSWTGWSPSPVKGCAAAAFARATNFTCTSVTACFRSSRTDCFAACRVAQNEPQPPAAAPISAEISEAQSNIRKFYGRSVTPWSLPLRLPAPLPLQRDDLAERRTPRASGAPRGVLALFPDDRSGEPALHDRRRRRRRRRKVGSSARDEANEPIIIASIVRVEPKKQIGDVLVVCKCLPFPDEVAS